MHYLENAVEEMAPEDAEEAASASAHYLENVVEEKALEDAEEEGVAAKEGVFVNFELDQ